MDKPNSQPEPGIDFGFETVPVHEKQTRVKAVFDSVASNYDLMNDAMSGGVHRLWKSVLLDWLAPQPNQVLLDVAGGTGDIASGFLKRGGGEAIICDINAAMLSAGARHAPTTPARPEALSRVCGNAEHLPIPDRSVDAYTIAFGIRNVTDRDVALLEAARVLRMGGRFLCLEFSVPDIPVLDSAYDFYSFRVLPVMGSVIAKDKESYRYLAESIRQFPPPETFVSMIQEAGLGNIKTKTLSGGIATLYSAWRV